MGAVQKLATVVVAGLVALATVLVVYMANEPNRRANEISEQEALSLERGAALYITYCLQCHGPQGLGSQGGEQPSRLGKPLNQAPFSDEQLQSLSGRNFVRFQSESPAAQEVAERYLHYMIMYGVPQDPRTATKLMPAFGQDLNIEEVNDVVFLIMHGNWDFVFNQAVLTTGHTQAQADCDWSPEPGATPTAAEQQRQQEGCKNASDPNFALYPTVPAPAGADDSASAQADAPAEGSADSNGITVTAEDTLTWSVSAITVKPGDTIQVVNGGVLEHDFVVDELGINQMLDTGAPAVTITIPADAKPGDYKFYCSIPGHEAAGMFGTLTVEAA